jgi:hypothetical protein
MIDSASRFRAANVAAAVAASVLATGTVAAETYPNGSIRLTVPTMAVMAPTRLGELNEREFWHWDARSKAVGAKIESSP